MQAQANLAFDNTSDFMKRAGFAEIHSTDEFISKEDRDKIWGYGPEDRLFYQSFFTYLDHRKTATGGKPIFAMLATAANHMPFNEMPENKRLLYPRPVNIEQNYANSLHLSDIELQYLLDMVSKRPSLANTIIIITGDHSFPINEHGYSHNENGYYNESFRIPFLILWNGHLSPQRISDQAFSQVDIAPTILDLADINAGKNSFIGQSLFLKKNAGEIVYLIQPYHGTYLQSIRYPYKYIYHRKSGAEYMFNLAVDPSEKNNIIHQVPAERLNMMRKDIETIFHNQRILDTNSLYK
jgi:phosphoglycerol transferase MdoB-like AlkP superfamily enzyme